MTLFKNPKYVTVTHYQRVEVAAAGKQAFDRLTALGYGVTVRDVDRTRKLFVAECWSQGGALIARHDNEAIEVAVSECAMIAWDAVQAIQASAEAAQRAAQDRNGG